MTTQAKVTGAKMASFLIHRGNLTALITDGSTILLTERARFGKVVVLGAPACGKTTLLQKMRYWAALAAYEVLSMHVWWMWWCVCKWAG